MNFIIFFGQLNKNAFFQWLQGSAAESSQNRNNDCRQPAKTNFEISETWRLSWILGMKEKNWTEPLQCHSSRTSGYLSVFYLPPLWFLPLFSSKSKLWITKSLNHWITITTSAFCCLSNWKWWNLDPHPDSPPAKTKTWRGKKQLRGWFLVFPLNCSSASCSSIKQLSQTTQLLSKTHCSVCVIFLYGCAAAPFHDKTSANQQRCNTVNLVVRKKTQPTCTSE